ncbi:MAG TPA: HAD family phosphatase [Candidatus Krumholzibacteria bacterium]|nr:HAD family phosphatase [Candidatus Krumholzibacteria bacterium]
MVDARDSARFQRFVQLFAAPVVIFDFDGILVDSERHHMASYNAVFQKYGHTLDPVEYAKYWTSLGHGPKGEIERHNLDIDPDAIRREKRPIFSELCRNGTVRFFPEARELVDRLWRARKTLAIASGTIRSDIEAILANEGIREHFASVVGSDVSALKPDPESFLMVLREVGASARDAVVIEDAEKGVGAAKTAGIPVIVVRAPETRDIDFSDADLVLESHAELIEFARRAFP